VLTTLDAFLVISSLSQTDTTERLVSPRRACP
jgi:hypothetical protein